MKILKTFHFRCIFIFLVLSTGFHIQCSRPSQYEQFRALVQGWDYFEKKHNPLMVSRQSLEIDFPTITPDFFMDYAASLDSVGTELALMDASALTEAEKAQFDLFSSYIQREKDWYVTQQAWQQDLWFYTEIIGELLFQPMRAELTEYDKLTLITARLEQLPAFLSQINANVSLSDASQLETTVAAVSEIETFLAQDFLKRGRKLAIQPDNLTSIYQTAVSELKAWKKSLAQELSDAGTSSRLGEIELDRQLNLWYGKRVNSQQMLSAITPEKERVFQLLLDAAAEVYQRYYPKRRLNLATVRNNPAILGRAFNKVRGEQIPPALWPEEIRYTMKIIHQFLDLRNVFPVTSEPIVDVLWLPPHLRALYADKIAISHTPAGIEWNLYLQPAAYNRKNAALNDIIQEEYNQFMLKNLAVELIPGSALQHNSYDSLTFSGFSRFGDPAVQLGWPLYVAQAMEFAGFTGYHPNFRLMRLLRYYRSLIQAELAVKYHIGLLEPETVKIILQEDAFWAEPHLSIAWRQICLQPVQNIGKIWGYMSLEKLRVTYNQQKKNQYLLNTFNRQLMSAGIVPVEKLQMLLIEEDAHHGKQNPTHSTEE